MPQDRLADLSIQTCEGLRQAAEDIDKLPGGIPHSLQAMQAAGLFAVASALHRIAAAVEASQEIYQEIKGDSE